MAAPAQKQWGITPPVSTDLPTDKDVKLNQDLMEELKRQKNFETPEGTEKRKQVLKHFETVAKEFIKRAAIKKSLAPSVIEGGGGMIATFGSYRLGAYGPGMRS